jgi:hypothetical protein
MWSRPLPKQYLKTTAIVNDLGPLYKTQDKDTATHLALSLNGRVRFIVPREADAQEACWKVFRPGKPRLPLRAMAFLRRFSGSMSCVESEVLTSIRKEIGKESGRSCCRAGAPGVWSKSTILLLKKETAEPLCIVKTGSGEAVGSLLQNEANWLRSLSEQGSLAAHIPEFFAHRPGADLSFVAESLLSGKIDPEFRECHFTFLQKLQQQSRQTMQFGNSQLYRNLHSRSADLKGLLSAKWSSRLEMAMQRIEQSLSGSPTVMVAAHNDFAPWNIRIDHGVATVFDWEYADYEQLPLFDPLHFTLAPMALKRRPVKTMVRGMKTTLQLSRQRLGKECCYEEQMQAVAYLINLCTLYLWSVHGESESNPVLESYSKLIDYLCQC